MNKLILNKKVYLLGIGGVSMSALALLLSNLGCDVSGYDEKPSVFTHRLELCGIKVENNFNFESIDNSEIICYSFAISPGNQLLKHALQQGKCVISRDKMLGIISENYNKIIAVAGTHGKSTTTAIISYVLHKLNYKPTIHVGADLKQFGTNVIAGKNNYFVTEACEYRKSLLSLSPHIGVILNIDFDHSDCYENMLEIQNTFEQFFNKCNDFCVINGDCINSQFLKKYPNALTFGFNESSACRAVNIRRKISHYTFDITYKNKVIKNVKTQLLGDYNILNVLAGYLVLAHLGVGGRAFKRVISTFSGIKRRFEKCGKYNNATVVCDYAHHPKELTSVINLAKTLCENNLYLVFQPHTYTRTKSLYDEFVKCFSDEKNVIFAPIYPAREREIEGINSIELAKSVNENGGNCLYFDTFGKIATHLKSVVKKNDVILILGAGDINELSYEIVGK